MPCQICVVASKLSINQIVNWSPRASASVLASFRIAVMVLYSALACHHGTRTM